MINKTFLIILISILITACGKKGDPVYNEENQKTEILFIQQNKSS